MWGLLLALFRLNGIACRTIGRYKCPQKSELRNLPLEPDYNHVWLEFYVPDIGWLPMESNVDDVLEQGPYPTRFFMGLAWYHTELGKGIPFAKLKSPTTDPKNSHSAIWPSTTFASPFEQNSTPPNNHDLLSHHPWRRRCPSKILNTKQMNQNLKASNR